jgi:predicted CopG family antitoxin
MPYTKVIKVSDKVYEKLQELADSMGVTPNKVIEALLEGAIPSRTTLSPSREWGNLMGESSGQTPAGPKVRSRNKLLAFKSKYMAVVADVGRELKAKYPDRAERVDAVVSVLIEKLKRLRAVQVSDYIFTLMVASKEFPELEKALPTREEVEEVLEEWRSYLGELR